METKNGLNLDAKSRAKILACKTQILYALYNEALEDSPQKKTALACLADAFDHALTLLKKNSEEQK